VSLDLSSKNRLTAHDRDRFAGDTLFDKFARVVCDVGVLPRKELYESVQVAKRVHRLMRGRRRRRVVDLACGHGLTGAFYCLLDGDIHGGVGVDLRVPPSSLPLLTALRTAFPRLAAYDVRVAAINDVDVDAADVIVAVHACGALTDVVIDRAIAAGAAFAVLPCCHELPHRSEAPLPLAGWLDGALAQDVARAGRAAHAGYRVVTQLLPAEITPKNRLLIGLPDGLPKGLPSGLPNGLPSTPSLE
jgi:hypothetical protein